MKTLNFRSRRLAGTLAMELAGQRGDENPAVAGKILEELLEFCDRSLQETDDDRGPRATRPADPSEPPAPD